MPSGVPLDLTGQRFDKLLVLGKARSTPSGSIWLCRCDCGGTIHKYTTQLRRGGRTGCRDCETRSRSDANTRHGGAKGGKSRLYQVWKSMHGRCRDAGNTSYPYYGAKGIRVCAEWGDFAAFRAWALANGYRPGLSIDRRDPDADYTPGNCEWVTPSENSRRANLGRGRAA